MMGVAFVCFEESKIYPVAVVGFNGARMGLGFTSWDRI